MLSRHAHNVMLLLALSQARWDMVPALSQVRWDMLPALTQARWDMVPALSQARWHMFPALSQTPYFKYLVFTSITSDMDPWIMCSITIAYNPGSGSTSMPYMCTTYGDVNLNMASASRRKCTPYKQLSRHKTMFIPHMGQICKLFIRVYI